MKKPVVIIVGGGAAGLIAANELAEKCSVILIEAEKDLGGRIKTVPINDGEGVIESGAEFVHGDLPVTRQLVKDAGLTLVKIEGKMLRKEGKNWSEQNEMIQGWDELVEKMKGQRTDMTMLDFMNKYFGDEKYNALRRHIRLYVQGFDVADPADVSVQSLYKEWSAEGDQFRLKEGYHAIVRYLEKKASDAGCRFVTGETVKQVDWQKNEVTVYTSSGKKFSADKLLITLSVNVMTSTSSSSSINLTPPVDDYVKAYRDIGYGQVVKVVFDFKEKIWKEDTGFIFSDEMIPTWWSQFPLKNNLLTGWAGGPVADRLKIHSDEEIKQIGITSLANIFDTTPQDIEDKVKQSLVFNWSKNENTLGAYSFATPASKEARKLLTTALEGTVYFAGEALYDGKHPGTVEAAFDTGKLAARSILNSLS